MNAYSANKTAISSITIIPKAIRRYCIYLMEIDILQLHSSLKYALFYHKSPSLSVLSTVCPQRKSLPINDGCVTSALRARWSVFSEKVLSLQFSFSSCRASKLSSCDVRPSVSALLASSG